MKCPLLTEHSLSVLEAKVVAQIDLGSHTIFIGETISSEVLKGGLPRHFYLNRVWLSKRL